MSSTARADGAGFFKPGGTRLKSRIPAVYDMSWKEMTSSHKSIHAIREIVKQQNAKMVMARAKMT